VCPTGANHEFEGADPRTITTDQRQCIGCGTCVEICPANLLNGGQTLRVMEAPTRDFFVALDDFGRAGAARPAPVALTPSAHEAGAGPAAGAAPQSGGAAADEAAAP
jgi:Fe-S-cluster-containing hydrogenase component 2